MKIIDRLYDEVEKRRLTPKQALAKLKQAKQYLISFEKEKTKLKQRLGLIDEKKKTS